jgi:hypothetical protein
MEQGALLLGEPRRIAGPRGRRVAEEFEEGSPEFYRREARRAREFADRKSYPAIRADLLKVVEQYEVMARHLERLKSGG